MRRIRSFFAVIALVLTLGIVPLQGTASLANAAFSGHTVALIHFHPNGPCPEAGASDC